MSTPHSPMMIGTCGGAGGEPHLQMCNELLHEISREHDLHFKLALIHSDWRLIISKKCHLK